MSRYDWLLFLHVLSAFALVASVVIFVTLFATTRQAATADDAPLVRLSWLASRLWEVGGLGTLVFGVWMAIDLDRYDLLDGWVLAALVLWIVASGAGSQVVAAYRKARGGAELTGLRTRWFTSQHVIMTLATALLLADMIFKPGV